MGYPTTERVLLHGPRANAMRLMLVAMSTYADDKTGDRIRPSMKTLVTKSGLNAGHANRTIRRLLAEGWIEVVGERSKGGSKSAVTEYRICLERLQGGCAAQGLRCAPPAHAHDDPLRSARAAPAQRTPTPCAAHTDPSDTRLKNPPPPPISDAAAKRGGGGGSAAPMEQKTEPAKAVGSNGAASTNGNGHLRLHRVNEPPHLPLDEVTDGTPVPNLRDRAAEARAAIVRAIEKAGIVDAAVRERLADVEGMTAHRVRDWRALLPADAAPETIEAWLEGQAAKKVLEDASAKQRIAALCAAQGIAAGVR